MSKKQKNAAPNSAAPTQEQPAQKKNVGYRILAFILLAVCAVALAVVPYNVFSTATEVKEMSLLTALLDAFKSDAKVFGALPALYAGNTVATLSAVGMYLFALGLVLAAIISLFAIFSAKKSPRRVATALFFLALGAVAYTFLYFVAAKTLAAETAFDMLSLAIAGVAVVLTFVLSLAKNGKAAWLRLLQFVFTAACAVLAVLPIVATTLLVAEDSDKLCKTLSIVVIAFVALNTVISCARMSKKMDTAFDLVRYILALLVALVACYIANKVEAKILFAICAAAIALIQIILVIIQIKKAHKKEIEAVIEETQEEAVRGFHVEEYAEAYAYEGGPVAGVLLAEEVNPSFLPHEPHVNTAGYDFYNCKSFDPFIATLNMEERNLFTEIFILKFKGQMPEIPDYEVGGDNKEFFRKIFIYLGQYRDRIPSGLLGKMYQFSVRL